MEKHVENAHGGQPPERRQQHHLRSIYEEARGRIAHFFRDESDWANSPIDYLAHRVVHETYPQLTARDVRVLVNAIERGYQVRY